MPYVLEAADGCWLLVSLVPSFTPLTLRSELHAKASKVRKIHPASSLEDRTGFKHGIELSL